MGIIIYKIAYSIINFCDIIILIMNDETRVKVIAWTTHEHEHREKSKDWYWSLGILVITSSILSIIFGNYVFGLLILIIGVSLGVVAAKEPDLVDFELNQMGVKIGKKLFPYATLEAFWVENNEQHNLESQLLIKSRKTMMPLIVIPLADLDPSEIRDFLLYHLLEKEMSEPLSQLILEYLGF
jgi:hypothetical protein